MRPRGLLVAALAAGACSLACSETSPVSGGGKGSAQRAGARQVSQPVVGGVPSGPERDAVLLMFSTGPERSNQCTATLVAPNLVVTAKHCVATFQEGTFSCTIEGNVDVNRARNPPDAGELGALYEAEAISFHPGAVPDYANPATVGKRVFAPETDTICRNDIAFVLLEDSLDLPIAPVRLRQGTYPGDFTVIVGYGINESRTTTRHERAGVEIINVGPSDFFPLEGHALPRTFVVGPSACNGDSGGPALADETGAVLGVSSLSRGECESSEVRNFFSQVAPYENLARDAFAAAGHEPILEPGAASDGSGGVGGTPGAGEAGAASGDPPASAKGSEGCQWSSGAAPPSSRGGPLGWVMLLSALGLACRARGFGRLRAPRPC